MTKSDRKAKSPPPPLVLPDAETLARGLERTLRDEFAMPMLSPFSAIVEGTIDRDYLIRAAELNSEEEGVDLLDVPGDPSSQISILTPASGTCSNRGGASRCTALAHALSRHSWAIDCLKGLLFVLDHDDEGKNARRDIAAIGFQSGRHVITLDPTYHRSVNSGVVTIEDLLSLCIQDEYFRNHKVWCSVEYRGGVICRYDWHKKSKPALRDYVLSHATGKDMVEVVRLLQRIRKVMGLPVGERTG